MSVAGKTILYTGAAGGLGAETTLRFLRAGARVVAIDNDHRKVEGLLERAAGERLDGLVMCEADLSNLAELRSRLDASQAENRRLRRRHQQCRDLSREAVRAVHDRGVPGGPARQCRCRHRLRAGRPSAHAAKGLGPHHQRDIDHRLWRLGEPCALCAVEGRADRADAAPGRASSGRTASPSTRCRPAHFRPMPKRSIRIRKATRASFSTTRPSSGVAIRATSRMR